MSSSTSPPSSNLSLIYCDDLHIPALLSIHDSISNILYYFCHIGQTLARCISFMRDIKNIYLSMLFNQLVQSIILCNACIWGHAESRTLTSIQLNALRFALWVGKACPIAGLFGESGWVPYSMMVKFNILRFRRRIIKMDGDRMTRKLYTWSESLAGDNCKNWAWKTKKLLDAASKTLEVYYQLMSFGTPSPNRR